ncbi:restriction endonuclease subunit S [Mucilaginibacter calamicampi]|uniref:Restriction endonuclease subunit S n=1 Tax=Mucilaginibacter calamicampi TaxID=1302352 RepID=A0ABW2YW81_9SPHI
MKADIKQTEVGWIPESWDTINLNNNFTLKARIGWQGLTVSEYLKTGDYILVTGTDFKNGYIDWDNVVFVQKQRYVQDANIQLQSGDILVTKDGTIGKVAFISQLPKPATLNSGVFLIRPTQKDICSKYIYYVLMSFYFDNFLAKITAGSTITHLYQKDFIHFNLPFPPLLEQKAIAEVLSNTDKWIESLEVLFQKKRRIKKGIIQELLRPKDGWEVKKLGELFNITAGGDLAKYPRSDNYSGVFKYEVYSNSVFNKGLYCYSSEYNSDENCITVTARGTIGYAVARFEKFLAIGRLLCLKPKIDLDIRFISEFINSKLSFASESTGVPQLTAPQISTYEINLPPLSEQSQIATALSDIDAEIDTISMQLSKAKQIKQGMMQRLLTGQIRLLKHSKSETVKILKRVTA